MKLRLTQPVLNFCAWLGLGVVLALMLIAIVWIGGCRRIERAERRLNAVEDIVDTSERIKEKADNVLGKPESPEKTKENP